VNSGLVSMSTKDLLQVVDRFAKAQCANLGQSNSNELRAKLSPPVVMFNREMRSHLLGVTDMSIRAVL